MTRIIPPGLRAAAHRAFVRTTSQAYAATLTTGISVTAVNSIVTGETEVVTVVVTAAAAVLTPLLAGVAAALSIISKGLPDEYTRSEDLEDPREV